MLLWGVANALIQPSLFACADAAPQAQLASGSAVLSMGRQLGSAVGVAVLVAVLGDRAEDSFRQSMLISQGSAGIFFSNWLVGSITALALVLLVWPLISKTLARLRAGSA